MACFLLSAEAVFSAAHTLPGVEKCDRLHGHNWRVRLTLRVDEATLDDAAMGVDFRVIEDLAQSTVADLDHRHLNELPPFQQHEPTAEHVARLVCRRAADRLSTVAPNASVAEVEVWELPHYRVVYRP